MDKIARANIWKLLRSVFKLCKLCQRLRKRAFFCSLPSPEFAFLDLRWLLWDTKRRSKGVSGQLVKQLGHILASSHLIYAFILFASFDRNFFIFRILYEHQFQPTKQALHCRTINLKLLGKSQSLKAWVFQIAFLFWCVLSDYDISETSTKNGSFWCQYLNEIYSLHSKTRSKYVKWPKYLWLAKMCS